ncbi:selenocysteine-specific elongation factor [Kytococcus aerolatus]|uniref:Selenocysteine-specific elongation factor n=1 Tax=Kytococcus aerolatus TaxID=592308 RepID=A0A212U5J0_9MICO|nr:SelB C-terminal domain-containing protein [Kytococcus aerolatus]SNC73528.1 selenocysteine-specific elongation factor [Kytococcus aerolatus]
MSPRRQVVATAGHVDHGKSTLVRALTGRDPDRLTEEKQRGLTIELGFVWTALPSGAEVAFVDVPGHRRFIGTMLSGLGPVPAVLLVVAADQGWQEQTTEHLAAVEALGVRHVLVAVTRADLADPGPVADRARSEVAAVLGRTGAAVAPGEVPLVAVSAVSGEGMVELTAAFDRLVAALPEPDPAAPVRLWADRSFTVPGSGTVVTGTLGAGTLRPGDALELLDDEGEVATVEVRGLHSQGRAAEALGPVTRAAVNLRRVEREAVGRGAVLTTPGAWERADVVDLAVRPVTGAEVPPVHAMLHVGTADLEVRVRPLGAGAVVRVTLPHALPWRVGDRVILRDPGTRELWAAEVLDLAPRPLRRRGAAAARAEDLAAACGAEAEGQGGEPARPDRRAALRALRLTEWQVQPAGLLERLGLDSGAGAEASGATADEVPAEVRVGELVVDGAAWSAWGEELARAVAAHHEADPLSPGVLVAGAARALGLPGRLSASEWSDLVTALAPVAGLELTDGLVRKPGAGGLGAAEAGIVQVEQWLRQEPFNAPEAHELADLALGARELAAAARVGRILRLPGEVVLLPDGPARAMRVLAGLPQPFTLSEARQALGTTRRVAVPLLEHLDGRGWTRRVDGQRREVVR